MELSVAISLEDVLQFLPETTSLIYVDYNDSLDNQHDIIQDCIRAGNYDKLYDKIDEWWGDAYDGVWDYINELRCDIINKFELTEHEADAIISRYEDNIKDEIYIRCDDDTLKDLIRNTSKIIANYDTGYEVESGSWQWDVERVEEEVKAIKEVLGIEITDYDNGIRLMLLQATYGGNLLIYFEIDFQDFIDNSRCKSIKFTDVHVGVIDTYNGSGDTTELKGHSFVVPYLKDNLFLEKCVQYSWTYDIAGMSRDWCKGTSYELQAEDKGTVPVSVLNSLNEENKKYKLVFKQGKCSAGDMNINRHRAVIYVNYFPCGSKCTDCGTFWID